MKTKTIIAVLLLFVEVVSAQTTVVINGEVQGMSDSTKVTLVCNEGVEAKSVKTVNVKNGKFSIKTDSKVPRMGTLEFSIPYKGHDSTVADIRIMYGDAPMTFKADKSMLMSQDWNEKKETLVSITGGKVEQEYTEYLNATRASKLSADSAGYAEADAYFANNGNEDALAEYKKRVNIANEKLKDAEDAFVNSHPNYAVSAALLAQRMYSDFTYTAEEYDRFAALLKDNTDTLHVNFINRNLGVVKKYALGAKFADFSGKQMDNKIVKMSSFMKSGKYTLIDFWASWCGPCRAAISKVKTMAARYSSKLQVISASLDEKENAWRKAEQEEKMSWPQLLIMKEELSKNVAPAYMINSIPRLVLIAPNGSIVLVTHDPSVINEKLK